MIALVLAACSAPPVAVDDLDEITVEDLAVPWGLQSATEGGLYHGRSCNAVDYNGDGALDLWVGNPGDASYVLTGAMHDDGPTFEPSFWLEGDLYAWAAASADYDNDGDTDLYVSVGGNEARGYSRLLENTSDTGTFGFVDVTVEAGIEGAIDPVEGLVPIRAAGGAWGDVDLDGDVDLFVSVNTADPPNGDPQEGRNILYRNDGDRVFTNIAVEVGLDGVDVDPRPTRHSSWIDADNDGDLDLYEHNFEALNRFWRNLRVEEGELRFEDATRLFALPGERLDYPWDSFASAATDVNHDGWTDLIVFAKGWSDPEDSPYAPGHALFVNTGALGQVGFVNVAEDAGLLQRIDDVYGVMGCQIADLDADGSPDVYIGNGSPNGGSVDFLFLTDGERQRTIDGLGTLTYPSFVDRTDLVDFPADMPADLVYAHPYPYHTHGTCAGDFDFDGYPELFVTNGGPAVSDHEEPDRLFDIQHSSPPSATRIRLEGDGRAVNRDAIQSSVRITWIDREGVTRFTRGLVAAGSAFSAQNDRTLFLAMPGVVRVAAVEVQWTDGTTTDVDPGLIRLDPTVPLVVTR